MKIMKRVWNSWKGEKDFFISLSLQTASERAGTHLHGLPFTVLCRFRFSDILHVFIAGFTREHKVFAMPTDVFITK